MLKGMSKLQNASNSIEKNNYFKYHYSPTKQQPKEKSQIRRTISTHEINKPSVGEHANINAFHVGQTSSTNVIRVFSRGINVISSRHPSSQAKNNLQLSKSKDNQKNGFILNSQTTLRYQSGITIPQENSTYKKQQMEMIAKLYAQKCYERCQKTYSCQLQKLAEIIKENEIKIEMQNIKIKDFNEKANKNKLKYQDKIAILNQSFISFEKYHSQCYQYTIQRIYDIQHKLNTIIHIIQNIHQNQNIPHLIQSLKEAAMNFANNSFQSTFNYRMKSIQKIEQTTDKINQFSQEIQNFNNQIFLLKQKYIEIETIKDQITFFKSNLNLFKQYHLSGNLQGNQSIFNKIQQLKEKLQKISNKLNLCSNSNITISQKILNQEAEEKAKATISQLSTIINQLRRQNNMIQQKLTNTVLSYQNLKKQLSDKMNMMSIQQNYRLEEFKIKLEEIERLERQKLRILLENREFQKQIKTLSQQNNKIRFEKIQEQKHPRLDFVGKIYSLCIKNQQGVELKKKIQYQELFRENQMLKDQIYQIARECKQTKQQNQQLYQQYNQLKQQNTQLLIKNEQNTSFLNNYTDQFVSQSQMFQDNINSLQNQIKELQNQKNLLIKHINQQQNYSEYYNQKKLRKNKNKSQDSCINVSPNKNEDKQQNISYFGNIHLSQTKCSKRQFLIKSNSTERQEVVQLLKNALQRNKLELPVNCQIDETGYLKSIQLGTYIMDEDGSLFCLTQQYKEKAVMEGIINIY